MTFTFITLVAASIIIAAYFWAVEKVLRKWNYWLGTLGSESGIGTDLHKKFWKRMMWYATVLLAWSIPFAFLWLIAHLISIITAKG